MDFCNVRHSVSEVPKTKAKSLEVALSENGFQAEMTQPASRFKCRFS
jgi:hypothetical protein